MGRYEMNERQIERYARHLRREERADSTVQKYLHSIRAFAKWLDGRPATKQATVQWKEKLLKQGKSPGTVNGALASLHSFYAFMGWNAFRARYLKVQRQVFRDASRELTHAEYQRLVGAAQAKGSARLALLLETICATGIRVSEARYMTVEAARNGRAEVSLKGKIRTILIPSKLAKKLLKYAQNAKIASGEIFLTESGKSLSRRQIWGDMKRLCKAARVTREKVFPHNLRHLFARAFYKACRDIVRLADVLGHANIETTRIYLIATGDEHARLVDRLGFVV